MHIMIHACLKRNSYVYNELIPSLLAQGIKEEEIHVWMDIGGDGNLKSCLNSFRACGLLPGGTWHLQDDVIIARNFAEIARSHDENIVACGYVNDIAGPDVYATGLQPPKKLWYSFPCIHIPNHLASEFSIWFLREGKNVQEYGHFVSGGKGADYLFWQFLMRKPPEIMVLNMVPNIVDHIDYLIGGSVTNPQRRKPTCRALYFEDSDLVDAFAQKQKMEERKNG